MPAPHGRDAELVAAYLATTWTIRLPAGPARVRIGERLSGPAPRPAGIVTAFNPASRACGPERNARANHLLLRAIRARGLAWHPALAHGTGPDAHLWDEPGFALPHAPREAVVRLGRRFGQNAVVWIDPSGLATLVATRAGFAGCAVGDLVPGTPHETADPEVADR